MSAVSPSVAIWESLMPEVADGLLADILASGHSSQVADRALQLLDRVYGQPERCGDSDVIDGVWLETHTLGCRQAADEPEEVWWDSHLAIADEYRADGVSLVLGDPSDGVFLTLTPQRWRVTT